MELSDKIRIIRKARGLSQEALGDRLSRVSKDGISRQSVSDWENGKSEPKLDNIRDLAKVLDISFDSLLDESIDLNDQTTLNSVLCHSVPPIQNENEIVNIFKYELYVNTISLKSFRRVIVAGSVLILTVLFGCLAYFCDWGWAWMFILTIGGGVTVGVMPLSVMDLIWIAKGRVRARVGELNNTNLILYAYKEVGNTLCIPIGQIEKMELGKEQKKRCGDVLIYVVGRNRPITVKNAIAPQKLIDVFTRLVNGNDEYNL